MTSLNYPSRQGGLRNFFVNKFYPYERITSASCLFWRSFVMIEYAIVVWLMCFFVVWNIFLWNAFCITLEVVQSLGHILFETALTCGLRRGYFLNLAVCVPIHLFVITACDIRTTPDIICVGTDDFYRLSCYCAGGTKNIAGPNHV